MADIIGAGTETLLEGAEGADLILGAGIAEPLLGLGGGDVLDGGGDDVVNTDDNIVIVYSINVSDNHD